MGKSTGIATSLLVGAGVVCVAVSFALLPTPIPSTGDLTAIVRGGFAQQIMTELDYDIEGVRKGERDVPHIFLAALPADLANVRTPATRKDMFVAMILPLVLRANDEIAANRARLTEIAKRVRGGGKLAAEDRLWLAAIGERYDTNPGDLEELARRIDVVPPSLALAQAAEESGWGTSRFAHEGNALFGQRSYSAGVGLAPTGVQSESFRVRAYSDLGNAVASYTHNLNTNAAYAQFRQERARKRAADEAVGGHHLAETLVRYSERGSAYVETLQRLIRANRLEGFDKARLGDRFAGPAVKPDI
jgi:Bax protein